MSAAVPLARNKPACPALRAPPAPRFAPRLPRASRPDCVCQLQAG